MSDDLGLSSTAGVSFQRLTTGSGAVSIRAALDKLAASIPSGGAGIEFSSDAPGYAIATVSPDEKVVNVSIVDGAGRTVMQALQSGPAAVDPGAAQENEPNTPNILLDWTCALYDQYTPLNGKDASQVRVINQDGKTRTVISNGFGWSVKTKDEMNYETEYAYDASSNLVKVTDAEDQVMRYEYDLAGRQTASHDDQLGVDTEVKYYPANHQQYPGLLEKVGDGRGNFTVYEAYDDVDRPTEIRDRTGHVSYLRYNLDPQSGDFVDEIEDANGNVTRFQRDKLGRRSKVKLLGDSTIVPQVTQYFYDPASRMSEVQYQSGHKRKYYYQMPGVVDRIEYLTPSQVVESTDNFTYNTVLQRTVAEQWLGSTDAGSLLHSLAYEYSLRGQIASETTSFENQNYPVHNLYDARGRLQSVTYPSGRKVEYQFTPRSQLEKIFWGGTASTVGDEIENRVYNKIGQLVGVDRPWINVNDTRVYDSLRLMSIDNTTVGEVTYTYDKNNNKLSESWENGSPLSTWNFSTQGAGGAYDLEDRFLNYNRSNLNETVSINRDAIGNIDQITGGQYAGARTFNSLNQLTKIGSRPDNDFDSDGNLTTRYSNNNAQSTTQFDWEIGSGRLSSVDVSIEAAAADGSTAGIHKYGYDASGRRAWKQIQGLDKQLYIYSGPNRICSVTVDSSTGQGTIENENVFGLMVDSVALIARNSDQDRYAAVRNQQYSVVALLGSNGSAAEYYHYNSFGQRTVLGSNLGVLSDSQFANDFGYTSREHDIESGNAYFRARYYDPNSGEFISQDPSGYIDGMSVYRGYMGFKAIDPFGNDISVIDGETAEDEILRSPDQARFVGDFFGGQVDVELCSNSRREICTGFNCKCSRCQVSKLLRRANETARFTGGMQKLFHGEFSECEATGETVCVEIAAAFVGVDLPCDVRDAGACFGRGEICNGLFYSACAAPFFGVIKCFKHVPRNVDDIALGLDRGRNGERLLQPFADDLGAVGNRDWIARGLADEAPFVRRFYQASYRSTANGGRIKFNLDDLDLDRALSTPRCSDPFDVGVTNWELQQVLNNRQFYDATDFFIGGQKLNAEDVIGFGLGFGR